MNILDNVKGFSSIKKGYLQTSHGYYVTAFNTLIKKATNKDIELSSHYALELISDYDEINIKLLSLVHLSRKQELSYTLDIYDVKIGKLIQGRLFITISNLIKVKMISFNYYNRVSYHKFNHDNGIKHKYDKTASNKSIQRQKQHNYHRNKKYRK